MNYTYYLGQFNKDTNLFNKNLGKERWESLKNGKTKVRSWSELRYYTIDRCFIKNKTNGKVYTEKYLNSSLKGINELSVEVVRQELPFFPTQYNYFNKQINQLEEYKDSLGNIITFSEYLENGIHYYEIYSSSSISSSSL